MKISTEWLKSFIPFTLTTEELAEVLTLRGLEVTAIHAAIPNKLAGLLIGEVVTCTAHPNADRLCLTEVDVGLSRCLPIVCGAPNVRAGMKVVVATVGSQVYSGESKTLWTLKKSKIRGEWSEGMLCTEAETGVGVKNDALLHLDTTLPPGTPASVYFQDLLDDIIEIDITPNRGDACSHLGVARELKAILQVPVALPSAEAFISVVHPSPTPLTVNLADSTQCPRYGGVWLSNVVVQPSPHWLRIVLERIGVKSINNVVDVTNFVLHDIGQPLHAFDSDRIEGNRLTVKQLEAGTLFMGLDGVERKLVGDELMICDAKGSIAMAGIIGGMHTAINPGTKNVWLESAYFTPTSIRKSVLRHNLHTEASFRFERGIDPDLTIYALKRAISLLQQLIPSLKVYEIVELFPIPLPNAIIPIKYEQIAAVLGVDLGPPTIKQILTNLDIKITKEQGGGLTAVVPLFRTEVTREADLIEEIARIYGYDRLPVKGNVASTYVSPESIVGVCYKVEQAVSNMLAAQGLIH